MIRVDVEAIASNFNFVSRFETLTLRILEGTCSDSTTAEIHHQGTSFVRSQSLGFEVVFDDLVIDLPPIIRDTLYLPLWFRAAC